MVEENKSDLKPKKNYDLYNFVNNNYDGDYKKHIMEQYHIFVNLMDKVTERRLNSNTFFLTANTIIISALAALSAYKGTISTNNVILDSLAAIAGVLLCLEWRAVIKSYTQLNQGKFKIIHLIEEELPLSLFKAEWQALGEGSNKKIYKPITSIEKIVPLIFMFLYVLLPVSTLIIFISPVL